MDIIEELLWKLELLETKLWFRRLRNTKKVFLTAEQKHEIMKSGDELPVNIFNAEKRDYIVKPRTIHGPTLTKKKLLPKR